MTLPISADQAEAILSHASAPEERDFDILDYASRRFENCTCTINENFRGRNRKLARALLSIADDLADYWPLTVRQIFYRAVAAQLMENAHSEYRNVSTVLRKLRENDLLSWDAITDRHRRTIEKRGVTNLQVFVTQQAEEFLNWHYYHRCYVQDQTVYCEVMTEKDTLAPVLEEAIWDFCTRLVVSRGQGSASITREMAERFSKAIMRGQKPVLVHFGDLDPSGMGIPRAIIRKMEEVHGVEVELVRAALNIEQVAEYRLPPNLTEAKAEDPNYRTWVKEFGPHQHTYEVDALHPKDLTAILRNALSSIYSMGNMQKQVDQEYKDRQLLKAMRRDILTYAKTSYPRVFTEGTCVAEDAAYP